MVGKQFNKIINRRLFDIACFVFRKKNRVVTQKAKRGIDKHESTQSCPGGINIIGCFVDNHFNACDKR